MSAAPLISVSPDGGIVALSGATEAVVATVSGVTTRYSGQSIYLFGNIMVTTGTTTTACVVQVRRASLTGTQVGDHTGQTIVAAAGSTNVYPVFAVDSGVDVSGAVYVCTVTDTGGGTGGTTVYGFLMAIVA